MTDSKPTFSGWGRAPALESKAEEFDLGLGEGYVVEETPRGFLVRKLDPALSMVYVEPTSRCNLRCRTCVRNSWDEPMGDMSMETYRRLVEGLRPVRSLRKMSFWGFGEPLLHPDIVEMVRMAKELKVKTEIVTNGLLLTREISESMVEVGLDSIVISMDGTSPESYGDIRLGSDFQLVLDNVRMLQEARAEVPGKIPDRGPEVGIEFVVMRRNVAELANLPKLAAQMGAVFVVVSNLLPHTEEMSEEVLYGRWAGSSFDFGHSLWNPELLLPKISTRPEVIAPLTKLIESRGVIGGTGMADGLDSPSYCKFVGEGSAVVSWDGEVSPCVAMMHSYPCYILGRPKEIKRYTLGNVNQEDIKDIWQKEEFRRFRGQVQRFDFPPCTDCGPCPLNATNEVDCFGNTFPVCGDCLWAKGVLQCP